MGFIRCNDESFTYDHEGYPVMVVEVRRDTWRELGMCRDGVHDDIEIPEDVRSVRVQVACTCGWRSQRMVAPLGTEWIPYAVHWPRPLFGERGWDDVCADIWATQHRDHVTDDSSSLWRVARSMRAEPTIVDAITDAFRDAPFGFNAPDAGAKR